MSAARPWAASEIVADLDAFRGVFRRHAAGVAVITVGGAKPVGFTATSLTSVCIDPPMISFNISRTSSSWAAVSTARHLGVHVLAADQQELATVFATSGIDRFAAIDGWRRAEFGVPRLDGVVAAMTVTPEARVQAGDHVVIVARVIAAEHTDAAPLIWHGGTYRSIAEANRHAAASEPNSVGR